jgi:hypothetical protein
MNRKQQQKRTHILGSLIFIGLVALLGVGLIATSNVDNPLTSLVRGQHREGSSLPMTHNANPNSDERAGFVPYQADGSDGKNNTGIAWDQIDAVFFNVWILLAVVACYILVQQVLTVINNRSRVQRSYALN